MRRNGYLWTSGVNLDTTVRFPDADYLSECKISAICRRFPLTFCILYYECSPYFYFRFVWPTDLESIPHASTTTSIIATKFEDPTPIRSWVMSYNVCRWLPLKMRTRPLRMRRITWPVSRRSKQLHCWNRRPRFAYSLYNVYWATTTIKGRLLSRVTSAKALDCVNLLCVTLWPWPLTF